MDEPEQEPPQAGKRLTREDVLRLIEEHGGPEGLDLREADLRGTDLGRLDLHGALLQRADLQEAYLCQVNLQGAQLEGASFKEAHLHRGNLVRANLKGAQLQGANVKEAHLGWAHLEETVLRWADLQQTHLLWAHLEGADLRWANLQEANLWQADLRRSGLYAALLRGANLEGAAWGDFVLQEEATGEFEQASSIYRTLKERHTELSMYDVAGEFHYREMEARRKLAQEKQRVPATVTLNVFRLLYGYGERPWRVVASALGVVFGLALVHWLFGTVAGGGWDALYYSAVSFTALGYGQWSPEPQGWAGRFLGSGESFMGVFMMALFLVTFTRKMTR